MHDSQPVLLFLLPSLESRLGKSESNISKRNTENSFRFLKAFWKISVIFGLFVGFQKSRLGKKTKNNTVLVSGKNLRRLRPAGQAHEEVKSVTTSNGTCTGRNRTPKHSTYTGNVTSTTPVS